MSFDSRIDIFKLLSNFDFLNLNQIKINKITMRYNEKKQALIFKLINYFTKERDSEKPLLPLTAVHNVSIILYLVPQILKLLSMCYDLYVFFFRFNSVWRML